MARTFVNQSTQIGKSKSYDISQLSPGAELQNNAETLQDDLNALRAMVKAAVGKTDWYEAPTATLEEVNTSLGAAQTDLDAAELNITSLQGDVGTLQGDVSTLDTAVIKKDGSVAYTSDQSMGGYALTDVPSPTNAFDAANKAYVDAVATGLVIKAPVAAKYDFQGGEQSGAPALPTEPPTTFSYQGTTYTVTNEGELDNALGVAVDGDSIFVPGNTTITLTGSKTINRSIQLYGLDSSSVLTASFAVPANSGLIIVAGTKPDNSQNNDVTIRKLAITSASNANDHACIVASTLSADFPNGSTGLRFEDLTLNHTEFGITVAADSWKIKNCTFNYIPVTGAGDTSRHLGIYNIGTMGWVEGCSFPATTEASPRVIAMLLTASNYVFTPGAEQSGGYSGDFVVKGCSQLSGNLRQWMVMEVFKANGLNSAPMAEHGFSMWLLDNEHGNTSGGSHILFEGTNSAPLDFFNVIYTSGNSIGESTGTDKGMIAVDGLGSPRSAGAPTALYVDTANSGAAFTAGLGGAYVQGSDVDGLLAVNSTTFTSPSPSALVTVQAPAAGGPAVPSGEFVDVGGYVATAGDRIFVVDSYSAVASGIYVVSAGDWARSDDYAVGADVASTFFFVKQGDYADTSWVEVSDPAVVGTDALGYAQFSGPGTYTGTGAINVSAQNVISVASGGIATSMLADSAVTTAKIGDAEVTNDKLAGSIALSKLAESVYTAAEVDAELALKLNLTGGTMSGDIDMGGNGRVVNVADPQNAQDVATKAYVDGSVPAGTRSTRTYAVVTAQNGVPAGGLLVGGANGTLDVSLPQLPADLETAKHVDVFLNGMLLRPGSQFDVVRSENTDTALELVDFGASFGDTICVVEYTS